MKYDVTYKDVEDGITIVENVRPLDEHDAHVLMAKLIRRGFNWVKVRKTQYIGAKP